VTLSRISFFTLRYLIVVLVTAVFSISQINNAFAEESEINSTINAHPEQNESRFKWLALTGWHTQGTISRDSDIRIVFNREVIGDELVGKDASSVMRITPSITGTPIFKSKKEVVWATKNSLKAGVNYKVSIIAKGISDVPESGAPYKYNVRIIPLEYEVKTFGLSVVSKDKRRMVLKGQLLVSDRVDSQAVKKVIKATLQQKALPIEWQHNSKGTRHDFVIKDIVRTTSANKVSLLWNGKPIDVDTKGKQEIVVPSINEFTMLNIRVIRDLGSNPYVQVNFSEALDKSKNIKGLVKLSRTRTKVRVSGSIINIYPNKNISGTFKVRINGKVQAKSGAILGDDIEQAVLFDDITPQIKFASKGNILPDNTTLEIPFEAVGVKAVEVTAFEIYPDNMAQFLQVNRLSGSNQFRRVGRLLWRKTIQLTAANPNKWNRYSFDATELMKKHRGGLLRISVNIRREHSTYHCPSNTKKSTAAAPLFTNLEDNGVEETSGWDGISNDQGNNSYNWRNRNNACTDAYYRYHSNKTSATQNFIPSNIGLIAKQDGRGNLHIISTDIRTSKPLTGVEFEVTNYQGRILGKATSDGSGFSTIELSGTPFLLIAKKFKDVAYLKLNSRTALAVSHFAVGGQKINKGLKGFIYGERGVWRPGDDIYLSFVLQESLQKTSASGSKKVPSNHPVTMKLINPLGQVVDTQTSTKSVGGFYAFKFKTAEKAITGNWIVKAFLGGSTFTKSLMIETIRPNRLKMELTFEGAGENAKKDPVLYSSDGAVKGTLFSQWLHGATASNLKAQVSVNFSSKRTRFDKFSDFTFDDPARRLSSEEKVLVEDRLNAEGYLSFEKNIKPESKPAGLLSARFTSRVFEEGGAFSISRSSIDYHPYENYVGIKLPKGDATRGMLLTDIKHTVKIAGLNAKGGSAELDVNVEIFKISWKWWWDKSSESLARFVDGKGHKSIASGKVRTKNGAADWQFEVKYPQWGRYLIRACDTDGGHCTGKVVYIDWPGWAGRAQEEGSGAASRLDFFSDKKAYTVGETAIIQLPAATQGRALITVETGSEILEQRWIEFNSDSNGAGSKEDKVQFELPITSAMSPNAYVQVTLLQPHKDKDNDRPIRLYGIIPLEVSDPATYLKPTIVVDEEWKPESTQKITVSESSGKAMNYTLAVVDEGLLGLTAFKTPNLHRYFYSKEALGIKTWDLFDEVIGAYGGRLERMLALGGGDEAEKDNDDSKKRRFPPVVQFFGPFALAAGATTVHEIELPPYLGAVRVMLVAGDKGAYGKASKSVFVRQPLMMQASLPRVLGPNEDVAVPVTLFALDDAVKDVVVQVETDDLVRIIGRANTEIRFNKRGEKIAFIQLRTNGREGKTHLRFTAVSKSNPEHKSEANIYLDIRRANQETTRSVTKVVEPGESWSGKGDAFGLEGTNQSVLEISSVPSLNLDSRLNYLIRYPHGCLEQTTSSAFPQLYLKNVMKLDKKNQEEAEHHIQKAIERIQRFQTGTGDFSYWPGGSYQNDWASIYAGHFLIEAKKVGYLVPSELLSKWINHQIDTAQNYTVGSKSYSHTQAYRLYVLALAGQPQMGAMNRLRESSKLTTKARWMLASAYQSASQIEAARVVIQGLLPGIEDPASGSLETEQALSAINVLLGTTSATVTTREDNTFGSTLGDLGLQLDNLITLGKKQSANKLLEKIAEEMSGDKFQSTQGISWALMAVSRYLGGDTSNFTANLLQPNGNSIDINSDKAIFTSTLAKADNQFSLKNTSGIKLFATMINHGVPKAGAEKAIQKGLSLKSVVEYRDSENTKTWHRITNKKMTQGSDVRFVISVKNTSKHKTENIALTIPVAAGMEILGTTEQMAVSKYDYRDVRDDRIHYYFSLKKGEEKSFSLMANAAYKGRYYLPAVNVEAMYDGTMQARVKGEWIDIVSTTSEENPPMASAAAANTVSAVLGNTAIVTVKKARLFSGPSDKDKTKLYLIKGDKVEIITRKKVADTTWFFIRFKGKKTITRWMKAEATE